MNFLQSSILNKVHKGKKTPSGWVSFNCPMCVENGEPTPDKKQRGGFKLESDGSAIYHCFRCNYVAKWYEGSALNNKLKNLLFKLGFTSNELRQLQFEAMKNRKTINTIPKQDIKNISFDIPYFETLKLPQNSKSFKECLENPSKDFKKVVEYVYHKNEHLLDHELYWSLEMKDRFIIPFKQDTRIVGWTARYCKEIKNNIPKYISNVQKNYLYNSKALYYNNRNIVIIVEGSLDALALDCVAVLGNNINETQRKWINSTQKKVIILPDFSSGKSSIAKEAYKEGWYVSFPSWCKKAKDADEAVYKFGKIFTLQSIIENSTKNRLKIDMNMKKYLKG